MTNNYLSLLFAFKKNDQYLTFPVFQDLAATSIVKVTQQSVPDKDGNFVDAFVITAQNPKSLGGDVYFVSTNNFVANLTILQTQLNALGQQNSFTLLTDLLQVNSFEVTPTGQSILLSDLWVRSKEYVVTQDNTKVYLNIQNNLQYQLIVVDGDQTLAGTYYYDVYSA